VELSQKGAAGSETVASLRIKIPPAANKTLDITVTLTVSENKQMTVKTTVSQTASTQQFGPLRWNSAGPDVALTELGAIW